LSILLYLTKVLIVYDAKHILRHYTRRYVTQIPYARRCLKPTMYARTQVRNVVHDENNYYGCNNKTAVNPTQRFSEGMLNKYKWNRCLDPGGWPRGECEIKSACCKSI